MMRCHIRLAASSEALSLAILLAGAVRAPAQEHPSSPAAPGAQPAPTTVAPAPPSPARAWYDYRPGTAWGPSHLRQTPAARAQAPAMAPAQVYVSQSGWPKYAPGSAWAGYQQAAGQPPPTTQPAPVYVSQSGWATYAPSSAWAGYRPASGWQSYEPAAARPLNMRQARVPGPNPYADGLARSYHEYGTGRPIPLAKPWLPGSP